MPIFFEDQEPQHVGTVLEDRERNYHDDSDFYALVWAGGEIKEVGYNTTRFAGGGSCTVDATPETWAEVGAYARERLVVLMYRDVQEVAAMPEKGKQVIVKRGRKTPHGTTGELFWIGAPRTYGWSQTTTQKIGIATSDRKETVKKTLRNGRVVENEQFADVAWGYLHNVDVVEPERYEVKTREEVAEAVAKFSREAYSRLRGYEASAVAAALGCILA